MDLHQEAQQFGQLRARIEATFREPSTIVITSASRGDGKSVTAFGLASALAEADHRVLLIDANLDAPTLSRMTHRPVSVSRLEKPQFSGFAEVVTDQRFKGISFADERLETAMSLEKVAAAVADLQRHFDYLIVDAAQLVHSNLAVLFATIADGTMLTVRLGRLATAADDETMKTLRQAGATLLGALTVTPKLIKSFRDRLVAAEQNTLVPARHVTTRHVAEPVRGSVESPVRSTSVR